MSTHSDRTWMYNRFTVDGYLFQIGPTRSHDEKQVLKPRQSILSQDSQGQGNLGGSSVQSQAYDFTTPISNKFRTRVHLNVEDAWDSSVLSHGINDYKYVLLKKLRSTGVLGREKFMQEDMKAVEVLAM
ncbi:hypothetical protein Tco_0687888 [Tanacetum coccineum]